MSIQVLWVQFCSKENHQNESVSNRKWSDPTFSFGRTKSWPNTPTSPQHSQNSKDGEASHLTGLTWDFENGSDAGHEGQASSMLTIPWEFSWTVRAPSTINPPSPVPSVVNWQGIYHSATQPPLPQTSHLQCPHVFPPRPEHPWYHVHPTGGQHRPPLGAQERWGNSIITNYTFTDMNPSL